MTTIFLTVDMKFNYIRFGADIGFACMEKNFTYADVDYVGELPQGATALFAAHLSANPTLGTFLEICNALDLDPREYFELAFAFSA